MSLEELKPALESLGAKVSYDQKRKVFDVFVEDSAKIKQLASRMLELGLDHVVSVTGVDYPDRLEVIWHVSSYSVDGLKGAIVALRTAVKKGTPQEAHEQTPGPYEPTRPPLPVESLADVWPSALFLEREAHEMFGIDFIGHPDLRPILLSEDFYGRWPLRKDFTYDRSRLKVV